METIVFGFAKEFDKIFENKFQETLLYTKKYKEKDILRNYTYVLYF